MPVRRKPAGKRRRKKGNGRAVVALLLVAIVAIVGTFYLLERVKVTAQGKPAALPGDAARQKIPLRPAEQPVLQEDYSSAILPQPEALHPKKPKVRHGTVAVIVDDMGSSMHEANTLLRINVPITFSIIPGLAKVREVAEATHRKGGEVMVHIPMEPKGVQQKPFEKNGLLVALNDEEIEKRTEAYLRAVPHAVGVNNHMGSRFTEESEKMRAVLTVLKERGMFFVDSKTTPASVGDKLAREMGIAAASRSVFLDNVQDVAAIRAQLEKLADMARKSGSAVGICHPHKATLQALVTVLPAMKAEGINFVYASELVR